MNNELRQKTKITGIIKQKSSPFMLVCANIECPSCGNIVKEEQLDYYFLQKRHCSCGRKNDFRIYDKEKKLIQKLVIMAKNSDIIVLLKNKLIKHLSDTELNIGDNVTIKGKYIEDTLKITRDKIVFEALEIKQNKTKKTIFLDKEIKQFKELSNKQEFQESIQNFLLGNYEYDTIIQDILILQTFGTIDNDDILNLALFNETEVNELPIKKITKNVSTKYIDCEKTQFLELFPFIKDDEVLKVKSLFSGEFLLSNDLIYVENIDSYFNEHLLSFYNAITGKLVLDCDELSFAIPINKKFIVTANNNLKEIINKQLMFLNKFDFVLRVKKIRKKKKQQPNELVKKYILYAKENIKTRISKPTKEHLSNYFVKKRKEDHFSARQLETIVKLTRSIAKKRLAKETSVKDAKTAINIYENYIKTIPTKEKLFKDIDKIQKQFEKFNKTKNNKNTKK